MLQFKICIFSKCLNTKGLLRCHRAVNAEESLLLTIALVLSSPVPGKEGEQDKTKVKKKKKKKEILSKKMLCAFSCHLLAGDFMSCNSWEKSMETKRKKGGKKKKPNKPTDWNGAISY